MSQGDKISHIPSLYYTTLQMDYLIICDDDPCAAKILKLFEVWSKDKDSAVEQARCHNAAAQKEGLQPSYDESHWLYNTIPNLQRRLLFEYGEKTIAKSLKLLQTKEFITIRNNPQYKWDRTKQYLFHTQVVQEAIYGITVEQITPYYAGFDPIKAETLAAIDTAKMRDANRLKCGMHDAKVRLQSGTKEGDENAEVRDDPNSLSISYSNSSLTSTQPPQGEPEQESGEGKPIESTPEPSPTSPTSLQSQSSPSAQPTAPHKDQSSGVSIHSDKAINERHEQNTDAMVSVSMGSTAIPSNHTGAVDDAVCGVSSGAPTGAGSVGGVERVDVAPPFRDRYAERMSRTAAKQVYEIKAGVPDPEFVKWRAKYYLKKGGEWADAPSYNASQEIKKNPQGALILWEDYQAFLGSRSLSRSPQSLKPTQYEEQIRQIQQSSQQSASTDVDIEQAKATARATIAALTTSKQSRKGGKRHGIS